MMSRVNVLKLSAKNVRRDTESKLKIESDIIVVNAFYHMMERIDENCQVEKCYNTV